MWPWWAELRLDNVCTSSSVFAPSSHFRSASWAQQPRAYSPAEPGDWSIKTSHEQQLDLDSLYCTRRCRLSWSCTVSLQPPRADPPKTTGNVSDAGASMMHHSDEDKVNDRHQLG